MTGTPKSLRETVERVIRQEHVATVNDLTSHIQDYLSQHFTAAMFSARKAESPEQAIRDLWKAITGKELK